MTVQVTTGADGDAPRRVAGLVDARVASRLADGDPAYGGGTAAAASGWVGAARSSRPLLGQVAGLRERFLVAGAHRVLLVAAPGLGQAAELLAGPGAPLTVLDTADPGQVADALAGELTETVLVVADPVGAPGPTATVAGVVADALRAEGLDPAARTVVLTGAGTPLAERTAAAGATLVTSVDLGPDRFGALGPAGIVPAGLAGADVAAVLDDAMAAAGPVGGDEPANPALRLAAALTGATGPLVLHAGTGPAGLAAWVAQLAGASLGLAVVVADGREPLPPGTLVAFGPGADAGLATAGTAGAQVVLWQRAVAVAGLLLGVDPFAPVPDPGTESSPGPAFVHCDVEVHAGPWLPPGTATVNDALRALLAVGGDELAVSCWLDRVDDASAALLGPELGRRTGRTTTFGWAPRERAVTARRLRDAPSGTAVLQLTGDSEHDLPGLAGITVGQAAADGAGLARGGTPVLRLHLRDRLGGLVTAVRAVQAL